MALTCWPVEDNKGGDQVLHRCRLNKHPVQVLLCSDSIGYLAFGSLLNKEAIPCQIRGSALCHDVSRLCLSGTAMKVKLNGIILKCSPRAIKRPFTGFEIVSLVVEVNY